MHLLNLHNALVLFACSVAAGAINSVAGGGSFVSFPALLFTGVPPVQANATSTMALIPGGIGAAAAYYREYATSGKKVLVPLVITGLIGGLIGAFVLLSTPQQTFLRLIPYLLGGATLLFIISGPVTRWVRSRSSSGGKVTLWGRVWTLGMELCIAIYVGYFGAGGGILTLALLALMGMESIHTMNAFKSLLVVLCNVVAVIVFIASGKIFWPQAILMLVGASLGGYFGAYFAQKIDPRYVRLLVILTGFGLTAYFFVKYGF